MTPAPYTLPFDAIGADDLPLVGGKGANLGEMARAGFPVPPGFCVTTAAYRRFLEASGQEERIFELLDEVRGDDLDRARVIGREVRAILLAAPIPDDIADAVREAWRALGVEHAYAVRSSATAEDLPGASFAGQQETFLNVRGEEALLDAVRRAWVSLFTDRAILYRVQQGFDHRDVALAVVVQRMVFAEKSGILFTADPVSGHRFTMVINASFGLGEAIVSGIVTPDTYRVDKRSRQVIAREIAEKTIAIVPDPAGGTRRIDLPPERRRAPVLTDEELAALTELGGRVETHYGEPQDIEWAIEAEDLYLVQTRPITTLYPIDGLESPDGSLRIYFNMGYQQGMTDVMAPLSLSSFPILLPLGRAPDGLTNPYLRPAGGRLFVDLTPLLRHPFFRRVVLSLLSQFHHLARRMLEEAMRRPGFRKARPARFPWRSLPWVARIGRRVFAALWLRDLTGFVDRIDRLHDEYVAEVRRTLRDAPEGEPRLRAAVTVMHGLFPFFLNWVPEAGAGIAAARILGRLAHRYLPADQAEAVTLALPGNVVNEMNLALDDLATLARRSPELVEHFSRLGDDAHAWLEQAAKIEGAGPFLEGLERFLERYGVRGPAEIDIARPRWIEDPLPLLQVIAAHVLGPVRSQRDEWDRMVGEREAAYEALVAAVRRGPAGWLRVRLVRRLYHVAVAVGGMREHHKFLAIRVLWEIKQVLRSEGERLAARGALAAADDVFWLWWRELFDIEEGAEADWPAVVADRRERWRRYARLRPPMVITSEGETPIVSGDHGLTSDDVLVGQPVSPGVVEGVAHVVRDPQRERLEPGEILVAEYTDPGWTPLFINAAGLVLEVGGTLTHGAVVAREYGIPAVVGVAGATERIRTGQRIRVDGDRGVVEILDGDTTEPR